jgi:hypothetical protein
VVPVLPSHHAPAIRTEEDTQAGVKRLYRRRDVTDADEFTAEAQLIDVPVHLERVPSRRYVRRCPHTARRRSGVRNACGAALYPPATPALSSKTDKTLPVD